MKRLIYIIPLLLLAFVSCRDFHAKSGGDVVLAQVGARELMLSELESAIPKEYRDEDSVAFVDLYVDKWITKQVKLREAERIFVTSEADIEAMVKEYRQHLFIKKLDELTVSSSIDTTYTDTQIADYYKDHSSEFKLSRDIVKGEVVRIPHSSDQIKKIKALMESNSSVKRDDMISICEKYDYQFTDLSTSWVEAEKIFDLLPLVRSAQSDKLLSKRGVFHMKDDAYDYYYQIFENKEVGDVAPLEWVRSTIRSILITERQQSLIRDTEASLYDAALVEGVVRRQYKEREAKELEREAAEKASEEKEID